MIQIGTNIFVYYSQMLSTLWYNEYPYFNWPTILFYLKYEIVHTRLSYNGFHTELRQSFPKETFSYDEHFKS